MTEKHTYTVQDGPKMLRETLCLAQRHVGALVNPEHVARLGRLIDECDRKRPIGNDGKHDDRHTPECGCDTTPARVTLTDDERDHLLSMIGLTEEHQYAVVEEIVTAREDAREAAVRAQIKEISLRAIQTEFCEISGSGNRCEIHDERTVDGRCPRAIALAAQIAGGEQA